jgi:hypothetical protein
MSESTDLAGYGTEEQRDAICLYYRSSMLYCVGSQRAEDLCDEIQRIEIALYTYRGRDIRTPNTLDRSTTVFEALEFYRDYRQSQLEDLQVEAGEL